MPISSCCFPEKRASVCCLHVGKVFAFLFFLVSVFSRLPAGNQWSLFSSSTRKRSIYIYIYIYIIRTSYTTLPGDNDHSILRKVKGIEKNNSHFPSLASSLWIETYGMFVVQIPLGFIELAKAFLRTKVAFLRPTSIKHQNIKLMLIFDICMF